MNNYLNKFETQVRNHLQLCFSVEEQESQIQLDIEVQLRELDSTGPLSGNGYFGISRGTLTSIIGTSVTYFIILLQFRVAE